MVLIVVTSILALLLTYISTILAAGKVAQLELESKQVDKDSQCAVALAMAHLDQTVNDESYANPFTTLGYSTSEGWPEGRYLKVEGGSFLRGMSSLYEARTYYTGFRATPTAMQQYQCGESFQSKNGFSLLGSDCCSPDALNLNKRNSVAAVDYLVLDESGKINISALIKEENDASVTSLIDLKAFGLTDAITKRMKEKMPVNARWFSWTHIWNSGVFANSDSWARKATSLFSVDGWDLQAFQFFSSEEDCKGTPVLRMNLNDETLWNGKSKLKPSQLAGLAETGEDLFTLASVDCNGTLNIDHLKLPSINWSDQTRSLPWLANFTNRRQRLQVAANLIDFCDQDHIATIGPGETLSYETTFCGLEKVPYINHIVFHLEFRPTGKDDGLYQLTDLKIQIGIANVFEVNRVVSIKLPSTNQFLINGQEIKGDFEPKTVVCRANALAEATTYTISGCEKITPASTFEFKLGKFRLELYSENGNDIYDVCINPGEIALGSVSPDQTAFIHKSAIYFRDCRCNTILSKKNPDGSVNENLIVKELVEANGQRQFDPLAVQSEADPRKLHSDGGDLETADSVLKHLSTAYIADGKIKSLWELGAVHRGFPWQTINFSPDNAGTSYLKGDLELLDQIKLTKAVKSTAVTFNPSAATESIWMALLTSLKIKSEYCSPASGKEINRKDIMVKELCSFCLGHSFKGRGEVALMKALTVGAQNDREQEEIIGKLAKYMSVRKNIFRLITSVLLLKKIPEKVAQNYNPSETVTDYSDPSEIVYYRKVSSRKILYMIYRDAFENYYKILSKSRLIR